MSSALLENDPGHWDSLFRVLPRVPYRRSFLISYAANLLTGPPSKSPAEAEAKPQLSDPF
jgi:hypothetical protein